MIRFNLRGEKGITMVTLVTTVILMIIIVGAIVFNSNSGVDLDSLNRMYDDIQVLQDKIDIYYAENDELPVVGDSIEALDVWDTAENDGESYYKIDIDKLDSDLKLNYNDDYYVNEISHIVYSKNGIQMDGKYYYRLSDDYYIVNGVSDSSCSLTFRYERSSGEVVDVRVVEFDFGDTVDLSSYPVSGMITGVESARGWYGTSECIGEPVSSVVMDGDRVVYACYE